MTHLVEQDHNSDDDKDINYGAAMKGIGFFLRICGAVILVVGALHLVLGLNADVLLGARLPAATIADPALDSQNRFYGVTFTLYGVLCFLGATDVVRYAPVLRCMIWVFFAAGCARLVSIAIYGMPPQPVIALLVVELIGPPLLARWLDKVVRKREA
ncbi:MAG: DUF4345 domain-containing protein [Pseudomonadota bacterium]